MKSWLVLLFFLGLPWMNLDAEELPEVFLQANNLYNQAEFSQAIEQYQLLLKHNAQNGVLHFNLANAYFKQGQLGSAIYHYLQARKQLPRDGDVSYNLDYARGQRVDQIPTPKNWIDYLAISYGESLLILLIISIIFWAQYLLARGRIWRPLPLLRNLLLVAYVASLLIPGYYHLLAPKVGVVKSEKVSVYSGIGKDQIVLFAINEGAEVVVNKVVSSANQNWAQIQVGDGNKGWVNTDALLY